MQARMTLALLATLTLAACDSSSPETPGPLMAGANSPIADVPVPIGFKLQEGKSYAQVTGPLRFVKYYYVGRESTLPVVKFFKDNMPLNKWDFVSQDGPANEMTLKFTKSNEDCVIVIQGGSMHTKVWINIDPTGRNGPK